MEVCVYGVWCGGLLSVWVGVFVSGLVAVWVCGSSCVGGGVCGVCGNVWTCVCGCGGDVGGVRGW